MQVTFLPDKSALVKAGNGRDDNYYWIRKPVVRVVRRRRYVRGKGRFEFVRILEGEGIITRHAAAIHEVLKKARKYMARNIRIVLEVLGVQNILTAIHAAIYTLLPDQFVFRFKIGNLLDVALGGGIAF
jgi:hypothetical protein